MPPKSLKRGLSGEEDIQKAIRHANLNPHLKVTDVARRFNVSYRKLRNRRKDTPPSNTRGGHNKNLAEAREEALKEYLEMLHRNGSPADPSHLILAGNRILYYSASPDTCSKRWAKRWIQRHKGFWKTLKSKPISTERRKAHVQEDIERHFADF
jgi:hypothetical protein